MATGVFRRYWRQPPPSQTRRLAALTYRALNNYSMSADPGSYSLTGTAATFPRTYLMPAVPGSYTLTGTTVTFPRTYILEAYTLGSELVVDGDGSSATNWPTINPGATSSSVGGRLRVTTDGTSFASVGQTGFGALTIGAKYRLRADLYPGNSGKAWLWNNMGASLFYYDLTPSVDETFVATATNLHLQMLAYSSTAAGTAGEYGEFDNISVKQVTTAAYSLTGTDPTLSKGTSGYTIPADAGTYALTGTAAGTLWGHVVTATPGVYAYTGTTTGLLFGHAVGATAGSYSLTGTSTTLLWARVIVATPGSYTLTGTDPALLKGKTLDATTGGSYTLTGTPATFPRTYVIGATAGVYTYTGTDPAFLKGRTLAATAGSYSFAGTAANFIVGRAVVVTSGVYALTGTAAVFTYGRAIAAAAGVYTYTGTDALFARGHILTTPAGVYWLTGTGTSLSKGLYSDLVPDPEAPVVFRHNEPEVVRVPKLNELARQTAGHQVLVVAMSELGHIAPNMGIHLDVWDAPGGYAPAYGDGMNWRKTADGSVLW